MIIRKLDGTTLACMALFEKITKVAPRDCFAYGDALIFVTPKGKAAKAIGKNGQNIKILEQTIKKQIRVIEYGENLIGLIKNCTFPLKVVSAKVVTSNGRKHVQIKMNCYKARRAILADNQKRLKFLKFVIKRYYPDISDVFVIQ